MQVPMRDGSGERGLMMSRRIDGSTTLEAREAAIQEFNRPGSGAVANSNNPVRDFAQMLLGKHLVESF